MFRSKRPPKKTTKWDCDNLTAALLGIKNGMSKSEAARIYSVPRSTIQRRLKTNNLSVAHFGRKAVFTAPQETMIANYAMTLANKFYGLNSTQLRQVAFTAGEKWNIKHNFNRETRMAGKDWLYGFLRRNPYVNIRKAEETNKKQISAFNEEDIGSYFENLSKMMDLHKFSTTEINVDKSANTDQVATTDETCNGFKSSDIFPINPDISKNGPALSRDDSNDFQTSPVEEFEPFLQIILEEDSSPVAEDADTPAATDVDPLSDVCSISSKNGPIEEQTKNANDSPNQHSQFETAVSLEIPQLEPEIETSRVSEQCFENITSSLIKDILHERKRKRQAKQTKSKSLISKKRRKSKESITNKMNKDQAKLKKGAKSKNEEQEKPKA